MTKLLTGKPQLNRVVNRRLILDRIRRDGRVSRAKLAKVTAIRPPTVSAVVRELLDEGLVEEVGNGETSGGRAPRMISLSRNRPMALGFELNDTVIVAGLCDLTGSVCAQKQVRFAPSAPEDAIKRLHELGTEILEESGLHWDAMQGIGIAVPGHLNGAEGHIRWSQPLGWRDIPFKKLCEKHWDITTDVVNDALAGGMAAHLFGAAKAVRNLVYLYLRFLDASHGVVGLGSGIILHGEPYHGEFGTAGEITTPIRHPLVDARDGSGKPYESVDALVAALDRREPSAVAAMNRVTDEVALLVLHAVNFLDPGMLIVGCDVDALRDEVVSKLHDSMNSHTVSNVTGKTELVGSTLGESGVIRGAVVPTLQRLFRMPRWA